MAGDSQSVQKCAELRQGCRDVIFKKMEDQHTDLMEELGDIKEKIAYRNGQESAKDPLASAAHRRKRNDLLVKILIAWGPIGAFLILLGTVFWLKTNGWL